MCLRHSGPLATCTWTGKTGRQAVADKEARYKATVGLTNRPRAINRVHRPTIEGI